MSVRQQHLLSCNLCEAICGIVVETEGDAIVSIKGDPEDPFSHGHICPKAIALQDIHSDPDRLRHPIKRTARGWEEVSWEYAFDEVASRFNDLRRKHGPDAVGIYTGNPPSHNYGSALLYVPFLLALGTRNRFSAATVDQRPFQLACFWMFGHQTLFPVPDVDRTQHFLILGANPMVSNGSIMSAPGMGKRLKAIRARKGKIVLVDPRRTETARVADEHHFIRPGGDAFLLMAMVHTLFEENLVDLRHLAGFTDGVGAVQGAVAEWTPESVASLVGIAAPEIRRMAREFAAAKSAVCYGRMGTCTQEFGTISSWLIVVLNVITGNLDRPGGAMFSKPAFDMVAILGALGESGNYGRWTTRVRKLPEFSDELPATAMAEEILEPGRGQPKAMLINGGNPILSLPNSAMMERAFEKLEYVVSVDFYLNETSRHADIILPPTSALEHANYDVLYYNYAVRNAAKYSHAVFDPAPGTRHDYQIFAELTKRLDAPQRAFGKLKALQARALARLHPDTLLRWGLGVGPYGLRRMGKRLGLSTLKRTPHGIDLGPLESCLPGRLGAKPKRIQLAPPLILADLQRAKTALLAHGQPATEFPLRLISRRQLRSNNSWMHNYKRLVKGKSRCTALIHPRDADELGVQTGDTVVITSRVGCVHIVADVTDAIAKGVVSVPHGWGHDKPGVKLRIATKHPGTNVNELTDHTRIDPLSGTAVFSGVPIRVALRRD